MGSQCDSLLPQSQGIMVWGARTVAPPDVTAWRYNNIRRFVNFMRSLPYATERASPFLNPTIRRSGSSQAHCDGLPDATVDSWRTVDDTAEQAFSVRVDETLNLARYAVPWVRTRSCEDHSRPDAQRAEHSIVQGSVIPRRYKRIRKIMRRKATVNKKETREWQHSE